MQKYLSGVYDRPHKMEDVKLFQRNREVFAKRNENGIIFSLQNIEIKLLENSACVDFDVKLKNMLF